MALLRATVHIEYEIMPAEMLKNYATEDPEEAAEIDARNLQEMPEMVSEMIGENIDGTTIRVEVVIP